MSGVALLAGGAVEAPAEGDEVERDAGGAAVDDPAVPDPILVVGQEGPGHGVAPQDLAASTYGLGAVERTNPARDPVITPGAHSATGDRTIVGLDDDRVVPAHEVEPDLSVDLVLVLTVVDHEQDGRVDGAVPFRIPARPVARLVDQRGKQIEVHGARLR